ncbi:GNAT family N-acetyltransferase [Flaviaesturariibacter amylovorans]|uniref:BioF2-like acetyltransferase domain-containing protein n=1 Tax=Flaviaesturariibacter amylovorans TaxID=1084520 RepID=A0ABP8H359_9BACT
MPAPIRHIRHRDIDRARWDAAIAAAPNGVIYARSVYLDQMAPGWEALVQGDYEAVFPLPLRRKWGVSYVFHPFLTAQLGLFGTDLSRERLNAFFNAIPSQVRYLDLSLNSANLYPGTVFPLYRRINYVLPLGADYETLYRGYRDNIRRNLKKAVQYGCAPAAGVPLEEVLALARAHTPDEAGLAAFARLYAVLEPEGAARTYGVRNAQGQLLASAVFLFDERRAYYILVGNHPNGRTLGASHLLIDRFIHEGAGSGRLLDFEGSDIRNLAFFYSSFGAREEPYAALRVNRLPWWARWTK